jgi:hypothetical protein
MTRTKRLTEAEAALTLHERRRENMMEKNPTLAELLKSSAPCPDWLFRVMSITGTPESIKSAIAGEFRRLDDERVAEEARFISLQAQLDRVLALAERGEFTLTAEDGRFRLLDNRSYSLDEAEKFLARYTDERVDEAKTGIPFMITKAAKESLNARDILARDEVTI